LDFNHLNIHNFPNLKAKTTEKGRRYFVEGNAYPSVTTVIGEKKKKSILEWRRKVGEDEANAISKRATTRGNKCHKLAEDYLSNKPLDRYRDDVLSLGMFHQIRPYIDKINNIHALEESLYSHTLKLAGRVDCIAEYDNELAIIDFKTSTKFKREEWIQDYFSQETAYAIMFQELTGLKVKQLVTIIAVETGTPQVFVKKDILTYVPKLKDYIDYYRSIHGDW
jgi:genome maintenance exonuclease 1|tara:strand:+ start:4673 stop:5341 length:669 start_codon:yes stop_codon:yes gene_type:complete